MLFRSVSQSRYNGEETIYKKGEEILVSDNGYEYSKEVFHSMEYNKVWCIVKESKGSLLRLWAFHKKIETKLPRFHEAQVGDLVYNRLYGYYTIDEIIPTDNYPLKVYRHGAIQHSFNLNGRISEYDSEPTWFYVNPNDHNDKYLEERPNEAYERKKPVGVQSSIEWVRENLSNGA